MEKNDDLITSQKFFVDFTKCNLVITANQKKKKHHTIFAFSKQLPYMVLKSP